jgi:5-methylcytosine-specific restriction endonuclease McrA
VPGVQKHFFNKANYDIERKHKGIEAALATLEFLWQSIDRPYYTVYPIITDMIEKMPLDINWEQIQLPFSPLLVRFMKGHEPYGISTILLHRLNADHHVSGEDFGLLVPHPETKNGTPKPVFPLTANNGLEDGEPKEWKVFLHDEVCEKALSDITELSVYRILYAARLVNCDQTFDGWGICPFVGSDQVNNKLVWPMTLQESVDIQYENERTTDGPKYKRREEFICKLAIFISMLGQGNDLITPALMEGHTNESDEQLAKEWTDKRLNSTRGFDIGKAEQERMEHAERTGMAAHYRSPHQAWQRYGPRNRLRKLIIRPGTLVLPKGVKEVPTGFLGDWTADEVVQIQEQKPYFRPNIPARMKMRVHRRDGFTCRYCGLSRSNCEGIVLHADHIISVRDGGPTTDENLITACDHCNLGKWKDSLTPEEIRQFSNDNKSPKRIKRKLRQRSKK